MEPKSLKRSSCSVPQCSVNKKLRPDVAFFSLPKNPERAQLWLSQIGVLNPDGPVYICEEHFEPAQVNRTNSDKRKLMLDAVPKLKLPQITDKTIATSNLPNTLIMIESKGLEDLVEKEIVASLKRASNNNIAASQSTHTTDEITSKTKHPNKNTEYGEQRINMEPLTNKSTLQEYDKEKSISGNIQEANTTDTVSPSYPDNHVLSGMIQGASDYTLQIHAIQTQMKQLNTTNRKAYLQLSLKLYLRFPTAYKLLQKALGAPAVSYFNSIFKNIEVSTDNGLFFSYLVHKVQALTEKQKLCFVCIAEIKIKPRFYYDIQKDLLLGIHDCDNVLKPEPAKTAVVLIVQGMYRDWKQPMALTYLADDTISIKPWVTNNISLLLKIGYNVQAIVCQKESPHFLIRNKEYLKVNNKKIFCSYDITSLLKNFYYNFTQNDYYFDGGVVKCQDIIKFYELDSMKELPLNQKIGDQHMYPANLQELKIQSVMEVCCKTTAAGMSTYIDFGVLDATAKNTVNFIIKISNIFDIFNNGRLNEKIKPNKDFAGDKSQIDYLIKLLELIESAHLVETTANSLVKLHDNLLEKLRIYKNFILMLTDYFQDLPVWRVTAAAADMFSEQAQVHSKSITEPTARDVNTMFRQTAIIHLLKNPVKDCESIDMRKVLTEFQILIKGFKPAPVSAEPGDFDVSDHFISSSEYNALELEKKDGILYLAGFLLKKCHKFHRCPNLNLCIYKTSKNVEYLSMCESIMGDVRKNICNVPSADFIEFVESMEIIFRTFINKEMLGSKHILAGILPCLESVDAPLPCKCFPVGYLQKLYTRFRIYHTLKYNNELIKSKNYKRLVVNRI